MKRLRVHIQGAGKVGRGLARLLTARGLKVTLRAAREGLPPRLPVDIVVLAVRDRELGPLAEELARSGRVSRAFKRSRARSIATKRSISWGEPLIATAQDRFHAARSLGSSPTSLRAHAATARSSAPSTPK